MKTFVTQQRRSVAALRFCRALTLTELMITMGIFSLVVVAMIYAHIFGMRYAALVGTRTGASDMSRRAFNDLMTEIRAAKVFRIGSGTQSAFTPVSDGSTQQGGALQLYHTNLTNTFIRYYLVAAENELRRMESGVSGYTVIATGVTNNIIFRAEDHAGNVLTESANNYVVRILFEFNQFVYPITQVGQGNYYDYYKLEFKATRRTHD